MPLAELQTRLRRVFEDWGQPGALRVDNGEPFGSPTGYAPPPLSLWLIGQGIHVIWNKPGCPQQNAVVEKLQDTTARWAEVHACRDLADLNQRLAQQSQRQRQAYPVSRLGGLTRLAAYPALFSGQRRYDPADFQIQRVWQFLAGLSFTRRVSGVGVVTHFNQSISIGRHYKGQYAQLRLQADGQHWQVFVDGQMVKTYPAEALTRQRVEDLTVMTKNRRPNRNVVSSNPT